MSLSAWSAARLPRVEEALSAAFTEAWPGRFAEACAYPIATGGKRVRPLLVVAAAESVGGSLDEPAVLAAAVAIELVHTYSLVHDDLPCMDDDDLRRGRPTVHVAYGENVAVLVGDALLTEAFVTVAAWPGLVRALGHAAGAQGMIAGQAVDIGVDGPVTTLEELVRLHRAKTGALLRASVRMGGLAAGATDEQLAALDAYGDALGLAFQVHDDLLDAAEDAEKGPDAGPPSFVRLLGEEGTREAARSYAARAAAAARSLPASEALLALARFTVERTA